MCSYPNQFTSELLELRFLQIAKLKFPSLQFDNFVFKISVMKIGIFFLIYQPNSIAQLDMYQKSRKTVLVGLNIFEMEIGQLPQ